MRGFPVLSLSLIRPPATYRRFTPGQVLPAPPARTAEPGWAALALALALALAKRGKWGKRG
jgi:hypothetical protein